MFLNLGREDFSWSRSVKAFPVFLLLWLGGVLLAVIYLFTVRAELYGIERNETEKLLTDYLSVNHSPNIYSDPHMQNGNLLQGLTFVRMIRGSDHIILINELAEHPTFKGLVDLPPEKTGVWLVVGSGEERKVLSIVTRKYGNDVLIQAAKDGSEWFSVYKKLVRRTVWVVLCSTPLLWLLVLYSVRLSLSSLVYTRKKITELAQLPKSGLLPESGNGPELDSLYKQLNRLIRQNRHLVSEMQDSLDNVAHDLRTPMTRLRSVAEYGLQAEDDTVRLRESLSDCLEESERVLAMLKIMMSVAEAESGTLQLEIEECELGETLAEIVTLYEYVAEEKGVRVQLEKNDKVYIRVDTTRISQVWANLLDNAIKYGREGGWVKISVTAEEMYGVVVFEDNGMGISDNEKERIWERLYRGDRSRSQKGLGLGLNYVRAVVEAHGGIVTVNSQLHRGCQFEVRLPLNYSSTQEKSQTRGE